MANTDRPNGLRPVMNADGSPYNGATRMYLVPSGNGTALFIGDLVKFGSSSGAAGTVVNGIDVEGMADVVQSAAGDAHVGVVVGFLPNQDNLTMKHRAASTNRIALVADPSCLYEIQEVSGGTPVAVTNVGSNVNVVVGSGNTTTGASGMELDNAAINTTAGHDLLIIGLVRRPDNNLGEHAKWLVRINDSQYKAGVTGLS